MRIASFDVGTKNLGIWVGEFLPDNAVFPFRFTHWEVLDLGTNQLKEACECMVREFERRPFLNECEWVLIENQIDDIIVKRVFKAGRMKAVGQAIATYFYTKRFPDELCDGIFSVSARNKLKVWECMGFGPPPQPPHSTTHTKTGKPKKLSKHAMNKLLGEAQTEALLQRGIEAGECDPKWLAFIEGLEKKDDVADAFLQAAYWVLRKEKWHDFKVPSRKSSAGAGASDFADEDLW